MAPLPSTLPTSPAELRAYIVERLVGGTAEPDKVLDAAGKLAAGTARLFSERLATFLSAPLPVEVGSVGLARTGDCAALLAADGPLLVSASGRDAPDAVLLVVDAGALTLLVSLLFGGDPGLGLVPIAREPSPIEAEVGTAVLAELGEALNESGLSLVLPLPPSLSGAQARKAELRDGPAVRISLRLGTPAAGGEIQLFVVQRLLLEHREASPGASGEAWGPRIGEEIMRSGVTLEAAVPLGKLTLGAIAGWAEGAVVPLDAGAQAQVRLLVRGRVLYLCEFGRLGAQYTVRIREPWSTAQELVDGLLPD